MPEPRGTPPFMQDPNQPRAAGSQMLAVLSQIMSQFGQGRAAGQGNPLISKGMPGQVPQMPGAPQVPGAGAGGVGGASPAMSMPGRITGPIGPATQNQPGSSQVIEPGLMRTGFEFNTGGGRDAAVVSSAIQGVSQFVSQAKQKKEEKTRAQAENYMSQIHAAQQSGDQETLNLLLQDPKVVSTLEKGLNYLMPKVPGEPPPPEATGVKKFLDKLTGKQSGMTNPNGPRLPTPNTPGGVAMPRQPQSASNAQAIQDIMSRAALQAMQSDPEMAKRMGLGTGLSGKEATEAERYQAGLASSPAAERQAYLAHVNLLEKFDNENRQLLAELASREKIAAGTQATTLAHARIATGPLYERAKAAREVGLAAAKAREAVAKGKVGEANKIIMQTLTSQITNLRTNAEKARKDDKADLAAEYTKQADDLQKRYDDVQKLSEQGVDDIINQILNE
jgi:hypothetical protein